MTITVDTAFLRAASRVAEDLAADGNQALKYFETHIEPFSSSRDGGVLMGMVLKGHAEYCQLTTAGLVASKKLLNSTATALADSARRYDETDDDAQAVIDDLFGDLDPTAVRTAISASTPQSGASCEVPSTLLVPPTSALADPTFNLIWDILNWPDYLSVSWWTRQTLNLLFNAAWPGVTGGQDIFEFLAQKLGGDWDRIALAGDAFGHLGEYYTGLAHGVNDASVDMFGGWPHGEGAQAAGEFLAELIHAFAAQQAVYDTLDEKYREAAWGAFGACNAMLSALDAVVDAIVASALAGSTAGAAITIPFTGGATISLTAVFAAGSASQAFSSAWGAMMTAVSTTIALGGTLGAATLEIEFIPLPEP